MGPQRSQHLSFNCVYTEFNLYLWKFIIETDVVVLTTETIKLMFIPLDIF